MYHNLPFSVFWGWLSMKSQPSMESQPQNTDYFRPCNKSNLQEPEIQCTLMAITTLITVGFNDRLVVFSVYCSPQNILMHFKLTEGRNKCSTTENLLVNLILKCSQITHLINRTSPFLFKGLLDVIFQFDLNFNGTYCKQTVETLIRQHALQCLIWVCTVCVCPTKKTLGLIKMFQCRIIFL